MERIFIHDYGYSHDWIMGKIADDIMSNAKLLGYECRCGGLSDYQGEDICYHLKYGSAVPIPQAKHNSVFYTHLNDLLKEINLVDIKDSFDSFICMSPEDAQYLIEIGFDKNKVFGKTLPVRNTYIRPISIGIFSACYPDGRKNEQWLIDFCKQNPNARNVNFVFVGKGWDRVVKELEDMNCTFEWHNVSRQLPYEYQFQQNKLSMLNYYIYMGMDGGAMGTYDAYAQDVPLCVTLDGFHKAIPDLEYSFDDKCSFFEQMDNIVNQHARRLNFFAINNPLEYVKWIIDVWKGKGTSVISEKDKYCISFNSVVDKKREQYYPLSLARLKQYIGVQFYKYKVGKKIKIRK